jgi:ATP-dependent RNA helicase DDX27
MKKAINRVFAEEKVEMEMRRAGMEVKRAENIVKYQDEIKNRPKKTWFMTDKEKKALKEQTNPFNAEE